jgi:hypothetical protein
MFKIWKKMFNAKRLPIKQVHIFEARTKKASEECDKKISATIPQLKRIKNKIALTVAPEALKDLHSQNAIAKSTRPIQKKKKSAGKIFERIWF